MKHTGILGGTFDPIHNGHLQLAETAVRQFGLDRVLLIPTGRSYHKKHTGSESTAYRLEMTKLAVGENPFFSVSDIDIRREGNTYTADTLSDLLEEDPDQKLYYIVGEDSLDYLDKWSRPDYIFSHAVILAAPRTHLDLSAMEEKIRELKAAFDADVRILDCPVLPISSTEIRNLAKCGQIPDGLVPDAVRDYIADNHLYEEGGSDERIQ